jgi:imidazolonepropionase-like amidohydrolase
VAVWPNVEETRELGLVDGNHGIIHSVTTVSAKLNNLEDKLGSLETGRLTGVIVVDGNPLEDLEALARVKMTLRDGKRMV